MMDYERDDFEITPELLANFSSSEPYTVYETDEKTIEQIREERYRRQEQRRRQKKEDFRTNVKSYVMPFAALVLLLGTVYYINSLKLGLAVTYNNEQIGVVEDAGVVKEAASLIDSRIINKSLDSLEDEPKYEVAIVSNNSDFQNSTQLSRSIIANDNKLEDEVCGVFVDECFVGSTFSEESAREVLDSLIESKKKEAAQLGDVQKVEFNSVIRCETGLFAKDSVVDDSELKDRLVNNVDISYRITVLQDQNVKIKYKTEYVIDDTKPEGYKEVTTKGVIGEGVAQNECVYIDGEKISSEHVKVTATKKPVNKVITTSAENETAKAWIAEQERIKADKEDEKSGSAKADKPEKTDTDKTSDTDASDKEDKASDTDVPEDTNTDTDEQAAQTTDTDTDSASAQTTQQTQSSSQFVWPTYGYITSPFGYEGEHLHKGIDIGAAEGTPVAAAASGTVVAVVYDYGTTGLGCYVTVDHGDGYQTTYAQCSAIYAQYGQHVEQGEVIAAVGSTGDSTGPHLHFRIIRYGEFLDPAFFLY